MAHSSIVPQDSIPLHRLLKQREAQALLGEFAALMPEVDLALISANGRLFVGTGKWAQAELADQAELAEWLAHARAGQIVRTADLLLHPLLANSHLVGALVARRFENPGQEHAVRCLHRSLAMLLAQALEKRDVAREALERYREINLLYNIGETIGACLNPAEIPSLVLTEARRVIRADAAAVLLPVTGDEGDLRIQASFGDSSDVEALYEVSRDVIGQARRIGQPAIVTDLPAHPTPMGAILCAPLKTSEQVLGVILIGRRVGEPVFTAGDEKLLMALAGQAAIAIEKARLHLEEIKRQRLEEELAVGRQIQLSLLPEACPVVSGWEFAAVYQPARLIGGDLYDFFELPGEPHRLGLLIADVTGKGVPAALFMAFSRTVIRMESMTGRNPSVVLSRANRFIIKDTRSGLLLSAFYATLDIRSGRLVCANAGHNSPLWLRATTGESHELPARGIVLGAFNDIALEECQIDVAPGDLLVFYTDGVTEARDANGQMFDEDRLQATVAANPDTTAEQVLQAIVGAVKDFTGDTPPSDDLTLFVVKRTATWVPSVP